MKPHEWRAVPYHEAIVRNLHRSSFPYLWECRVCKGCVMTKTEAEPNFNDFTKNGTMKSTNRTLKAFYADCDLEIANVVLNA